MRDAASVGCETATTGRPGFPVCTVAGTVALLILVVVTLLRDHYQSATVRGADRATEAAQVIAQESTTLPAAATPAQP